MSRRVASWGLHFALHFALGSKWSLARLQAASVLKMPRNVLRSFEVTP
jgi:hypothetical protein